MARFSKLSSKKAGLPPGTMVYIGEKEARKGKISILNYDEEHVEEKETRTAEESSQYAGRPGVTWINVVGLHDLHLIESFGKQFGLHPLILEDIVNTEQRPKMEDYDDYIFIVIKMLYYDERNNRIAVEQISLILGPNYLLTFQEKEEDVFNPVRERINNGKSRTRKTKVDYLAYALIDAIVDNYFIILEKLGEKIELLEEELVRDPKPATLHEIHHLKQEMIILRKSVWPLRELISGLERNESSLIRESTNVFLRDVYDHTIQVIDTIETFRDMVSGMIDIYLSSISNRMNAIMKVLTVIATIFIPLTFIAGVYGMNFKRMPELEWSWGYPAVLLLMAAVAIAMVAYFKKHKWL